MKNDNGVKLPKWVMWVVGGIVGLCLVGGVIGVAVGGFFYFSKDDERGIVSERKREIEEEDDDDEEIETEEPIREVTGPPVVEETEELVDEELDDGAYEPNDSRSLAYDLNNAEGIWLSDINGYGIQSDEDWYEIYVDSGFERVVINLEFDNNDGDIDIEIYDSTGDVLTGSYSTSDSEVIDYAVLNRNQAYYIRMYLEDAGKVYDL